MCKLECLHTSARGPLPCRGSRGLKEREDGPGDIISELPCSEESKFSIPSLPFRFSQSILVKVYLIWQFVRLICKLFTSMYVGLNLHSYPCPQVLGLRDLLRVTSELGRGHWLLQKSLWAPNLFWWGPKHPQSGNRSRIGWCKALGVGLGVLLPFLLPFVQGRSLEARAAQGLGLVLVFWVCAQTLGRALNYRGSFQRHFTARCVGGHGMSKGKQGDKKTEIG